MKSIISYVKTVTVTKASTTTTETVIHDNRMPLKIQNVQTHEEEHLVSIQCAIEVLNALANAVVSRC